MSIVGGGIIGATVSILQARFGIVRCEISTASFAAVGALAGFAGSMVSQMRLTKLVPWPPFTLDSLLGATLQQTIYDIDKKKILLDDAVAKQRKLVGAGSSSSSRVVSGLKVLTNNQVNFVSSATIATLSGLLGLHFL
ncbi:hypothetical protein QFC22_001342 [Naganishia vaughanmartiniae]|uniref:Uncharacterized protein n=1 Tax=Naganishia vaughanmartiniae TaxID=1424756 RepID=A0ACC2XIC6_9TREE|nr:hypothetical protein QFC22_001342 [Naganishia vaughanmartiniae]